MRNWMVRAVVVLTGVMAVSGCGRRTPPAAPTPVNDAPPAQTPVSRTDDDAARRAREAEDARLAAERARMRSTLEEMVFFDYDRSLVRDQDRSVLDAKASILSANPDVRLRIEGHADERGSVEYNLALGLRRAESVRAYLTNFGINPGRLEIATYGEERPLAMGRDEASFARNRRGEFRILSGLAGN